MISWETRTGTPLTAGDVTITPEARALVVQTPVGGIVWNRPTAILVERNGCVDRIRIADVTRIAQAALIGLSVFVALSIWSMTPQRRRTGDE